MYDLPSYSMQYCQKSLQKIIIYDVFTSIESNISFWIKQVGEFCF